MLQRIDTVCTVGVDFYVMEVRLCDGLWILPRYPTHLVPFNYQRKLTTSVALMFLYIN